MVCTNGKYQIYTEKYPKNYHCNFIYKHNVSYTLFLNKDFD
jgi:hypothetical protein